MTLMSVPIDSITEGHLRSLVENRVHESRTIDYKSMLPDSNRSKKKFLQAVCAFANTAGGDLVYGMKETNGVPQQLAGFESDNLDRDILRLINLIRDGIAPSLSSVRTQPVELEDDRYAVVLRVPRSFSRPHVVTFDHEWRFYTRTPRSNEPMDVDEVRRAFVLSESVADRIRAFRAERLNRVLSGETPVRIKGTGRVVLHVVPISAFDSPASVVDLDIRQPPLNKRLLIPISIISESGDELDENLVSYPSHFWPRYNFDGMLCDFQVGSAGSRYAAGYVQLFRTGVIEAADNYAFFAEEEGESRIDGDKLDEGLIKAVDRYFRLLRDLGVEPPVFLLLSLVGVRDYQMLLRGIQRYPSELRPVDRDALLVPEVLVESLEQDLHALQRHMRPLLDAVWNSVGAPGSPHYDESGNWQ